MARTRRNKGGSPKRHRRSKSKRRARSLSPQRRRHSRKARVYSARYSPGARKRWDHDARMLHQADMNIDELAYNYGKPAAHGMRGRPL